MESGRHVSTQQTRRKGCNCDCRRLNAKGGRGRLSPCWLSGQLQVFDSVVGCPEPPLLPSLTLLPQANAELDATASINAMSAARPLAMGHSGSGIEVSI